MSRPYVHQPQDIRGSLEDLEKALSLSPTVSAYYHAKGLTFEEMGGPPKAVNPDDLRGADEGHKNRGSSRGVCSIMNISSHARDIHHALKEKTLKWPCHFHKIRPDLISL